MRGKPRRRRVASRASAPARRGPVVAATAIVARLSREPRGVRDRRARLWRARVDRGRHPSRSSDCLPIGRDVPTTTPSSARARRDSPTRARRSPHGAGDADGPRDLRARGRETVRRGVPRVDASRRVSTRARRTRGRGRARGGRARGREGGVSDGRRWDGREV